MLLQERTRYSVVRSVVCWQPPDVYFFRSTLFSLWAGTPVMGDLCFKDSHWGVVWGWGGRGRDIQYALWPASSPCPIFLSLFSFYKCYTSICILNCLSTCFPKDPTDTVAGGVLGENRWWDVVLGMDHSLLGWQEEPYPRWCVEAQVVSGIKSWPNCSVFSGELKECSSAMV